MTVQILVFVLSFNVFSFDPPYFPLGENIVGRMVGIRRVVLSRIERTKWYRGITAKAPGRWVLFLLILYMTSKKINPTPGAFRKFLESVNLTENQIRTKVLFQHSGPTTVTKVY